MSSVNDVGQLMLSLPCFVFQPVGKVLSVGTYNCPDLFLRVLDYFTSD